MAALIALIRRLTGPGMFCPVLISLRRDLVRSSTMEVSTVVRPASESIRQDTSGRPLRMGLDEVRSRESVWRRAGDRLARGILARLAGTFTSFRMAESGSPRVAPSIAPAKSPAAGRGGGAPS